MIFTLCTEGDESIVHSVYRSYQSEASENLQNEISKKLTEEYMVLILTVLVLPSCIMLLKQNRPRLGKILWLRVLLFTFSLSITASCTKPNFFISSNKSIKWSKDKFTLGILATDDGRAIWEIRQGGDFDEPIISDLPLDATKSVLTEFNKQPMKKKALGIFVYSKSFAIPDTPEERQYMTEYLWDRYNNKEWRKSEADLINNLVHLCISNKIALYVNLSANLEGDWKMLSPPIDK